MANNQVPRGESSRYPGIRRRPLAMPGDHDRPYGLLENHVPHILEGTRLKVLVSEASKVKRTESLK